MHILIYIYYNIQQKDAVIKNFNPKKHQAQLT